MNSFARAVSARSLTVGYTPDGKRIVKRGSRKTKTEAQRKLRQIIHDWQENDLVFPPRLGTVADASHVRRSFRKVAAAAGLDPADWTPRGLWHSFVSLLSDAGVPIEDIAKLVGHSGTSVTEAVYRKQIRPVIAQGAEVMDRIFARNSQEAGEMPPDA